MKKCYKCENEKEFLYFHRSKRNKDGFSSLCKMCNADRNRQYVLKNKEKVKKYHKTYYELNSYKYYKNNKKWTQKNRERMRELWRINAQKPNTKHRHRINEARRRAFKLNATPPWLTSIHLEEIKKIYDNCPLGCHVDHIIPLRGKLVCGLHVPWNLQVITAEENRKKNNRLIL